MSFTKLEVSKVLKSDIGDIEIVKYRKDGTNRIFWTPEYNNGMRITKLMYGRMNTATKVAREFVKWRKDNA